MIEENKKRQIVVSEEVFEKLPEGFASNLEKNEKVFLVPCPKEEVRSLKLKALAMAGMVGIILAETSKNTDTVSLEQLDKIRENFDFGELKPGDINAVYEAPEQPHKAKMYVPRTIGKPSSKKQGSR